PPRVPPALIEVDRVPGHKAVPSRRGAPVQIERREPQALALRHLASEAPLQALAARVLEGPAAVPARLVQREQAAPPLLQPVLVVIRKRYGVMPPQTALHVAQGLPAAATQGREVSVPRCRYLELRAGAQRALPCHVPASHESGAQSIRVRGARDEVAQDEHLPRQCFQRRPEG